MFKKQIRSTISVPPPYFALGTRKYNIFHCQLRNLASNLNQHKFLSHLSDSSMCPCGDDVEDNFHYFYVCPLFICQRILLFTQLRDLADFLNIDVLLKGSPDLSFDDNVLIMNSCPHLYLQNQETINIFQFDFVLFALNLFFFLICFLRWLNKYISIFMCICMHMYEYALLCAYMYIYMYICILIYRGPLLNL